MAASSLGFTSLMMKDASSSSSSPLIKTQKMPIITTRRFQTYAAIFTPHVSESGNLPVKKIPGDYGLPLIGPLNDRRDFFYHQGRDEFFRSRMQKYGSTVYRVNMPPGPPIASDPKVIALLDGKSFPILFDTSKVDKKDVFTGTYTPSLELTGGYRVLSYLDPSEPNHEKLKKFLFKLLTTTSHRVFPEFHSSFSEMFTELEKEFADKGKAKFNDANEQASFNFLGRAWYNANPTESELGDSGPKTISKWLLFQLHPIMTLGLPELVEDPLLHSAPLAPVLVKKDYEKLYSFFYNNGGPLFEEAAQLGIPREEACHNLLFSTCFNTWGGMKIFFPTIMEQIGRAGFDLQRRLAEEIRSVVRSNGGKVTMSGLEQMELMKSVVYEAFRIEPPVPFQYGHAKQDLVIESHDAAFQVKKGEMLFGYQPFATKDPKIFDRAEEFVPDRFMGEGQSLLKHVLWSNGPETESPTVDNKQCAGKDFVVLISRLFVVEFFMRYDSFEIDVGTSPLGSQITLTSLKRATS